MSGFDFASTIKLAPRYVAAVTIALGAVLFIPEAAVTRLGLDAFKKALHPWLGGVFVLACSLLLVHCTIAGWRWGYAKRRAAAKRRALFGRLHALTADEQKLLRPFIRDQTRTRMLDIGSGVVGGLRSAGVIRIASPIGTAFNGWAFNLEPWAYDYLIEHPELVGLVVEDDVGGPDKV